MNKFVEIYRMLKSKKESYISKETYDEEIKAKNEINEKFELINTVLSAKSETANLLTEYDAAYKEKFLQFANSNSTLADEAYVVEEFQKLREELERMANFTFLYTKNIIAVGGGFSAGKSQFLNTFFDQELVQLPVGIRPVTAIPTYVSHSDSTSINAFSSNGGVVRLEDHMYKNMSHDYLSKFKFNLKDIIPFLVITTDIKGGEYENICFIDTPGYNPANKSEDKNSALEGLRYANTILWLIPISAGTVPNSDLEFLSRDELLEKNIYIVLSKCDEKPQSEIKNIISNIEEILEDNLIDVVGISAYSSKKQKEYAYKNISLMDFLKEQNHSIKNYQKLKDKINFLLDKYKDSIDEEISSIDNFSIDINKIILDLMRIGVPDGEYYRITDLQQRLSSIKKKDISDSLRDSKYDLEAARSALLTSVENLVKTLFEKEKKSM